MIKLRESIDEKVKWWDEIIRKAKTAKVGLRILRDKNRWLCRNDLYFLGKVTGHFIWHPGEVKGFVERFHRDLCDKVSLMNWQIVNKGLMKHPADLMPMEDVVDDPRDLGKTRRLFLYFRSAYKSTIVTKLHTIQLLLNFPDIHVFITHNTQVNASDILLSIKRLFLTTKLRHFFPEYVPKTKDWGNASGFSVACRTDKIMTGDNVEAMGINTEATGRKAHVFKNDDIVTEKSVTNEEQLRQSNQFLETHKSLFLNPSLIIEDYSDTKYHFADATTTLEDDVDVDVIKVPLLKENETGRIIWQRKRYVCALPEHFSVEGIGKENVSGLMKNPDEFNLQYMLNPDSPRRKKFTKEMIQYFSAIPHGLTYYLLVDPADSEEKRACYTAMKVIGVDAEGYWYWVDGLFDKIDDRVRIDEATRLAVKWSVHEVLWEILSFGRTDERNFERASRKIPDKHRTWGGVRAVQGTKQSKDDRIIGLNNRYSRREIFWPEKMLYYSRYEGKVIDIVQAQEYEFLGFPRVSHKDLLDAESFLLQVDVIPGDKSGMPKPSKFAHIKDPAQRGITETFWRGWEQWKSTGFANPEEALIGENLL